ncbi:hypothetical protein GCM10020258_55580 [Sphingomonas yabuuchiae]
MTRTVATLLEPAGLAGLAQLLDAADLPSADIADPGRLIIRIEADSLVGFGGLEEKGPTACSARSSSSPIDVDMASGGCWSPPSNDRHTTSGWSACTS